MTGTRTTPPLLPKVQRKLLQESLEKAQEHPLFEKDFLKAELKVAEAFMGTSFKALWAIWNVTRIRKTSKISQSHIFTKDSRNSSAHISPSGVVARAKTNPDLT